MSIRSKKKYIWILIVLNIVILGFCIFLCLQKERDYIDTNLADWHSELIQYNDGRWYIDENVISGSSVDMINSPYLTLSKGSYIVSVSYSASEDNNIYMKASHDTDNSAYLKSDIITLGAFSSNKNFRIEATRDIDNLEIIIQYNGSGYFSIQNIAVLESKSYDIRHIVCLLFFFLLLDFIFLFHDFLKKHRMEFVFLLLILTFASLPEMIDQFYWGHDMNFHLLRIEGIAQELRLFHIPAKLHPLFLNGYGYPVSVFYGDLFLYIPALLRIAGFSVTSAYKIYIFFINTATVCLGYICFKKIFQNQNIALIGTMIYTLCPYRLLNIYERAAVGEYTAMTAYPLLALAVYRIYISDHKNWKEYRKNALLLAISMTILISSHILSTEMTVWFLFLICITFMRKTCHKNTLKVYGLAVLETLFLNAYFLIPLMDYYLNEDVNITDTVQNSMARIQLYGAYIGQYFSFFGNARGRASASIFGRMQLTPGIIMITVFLTAVVLLLAGKKNKKWIFYVSFSFLALFMASNLFPWDYLASHLTLFHILAQVQFPWRYIGIATIFLTMLLCDMLLTIKKSNKSLYQNISITVLGVSIFMTCFLTSDLLNSTGAASSLDRAELFSVYDTSGLNTLNIGPGEYVRTGTKTTELKPKIYSENAKNLTLLQHNGSTMVLYCEAEDMPAYIEVPFFHYKGYHVHDESGNEYTISDGVNNTIGFLLPAHFIGNITVQYEEPLLWRIAEIISLIFVLVLIGIHIKKLPEISES